MVLKIYNILRNLLVSSLMINQKFVGIKIAKVLIGFVYQNPNEAKPFV